MSRSASIVALAAVGALLATEPSIAQPSTNPLPAGSAGGTVDGSLPAKTGSTTAVGQTKPPGAAAAGARPDLEEKSRELDRKIDQGICTGCK